MKFKNLILALLCSALGAAAATLPVAMNTTNGVAKGNTIIGGNFNATNSASSNHVAGSLNIGTLQVSNTSASISTLYKNGTPVWSTAPGGNNSLVPLNSYVTGNKFVGTNATGDPDAFLSLEGQYLYFNKIVGGATPTLNHNSGSIRGALSSDPVFLIDAYTNTLGITGTTGIVINAGTVGTVFTGPITALIPTGNATNAAGSRVRVPEQGAKETSSNARPREKGKMDAGI